MRRTATTGRDLRRRSLVRWRRLALLVSPLAILLVAPEILNLQPYAINAACRLCGPNRDFPIGTDELGRDLASRVLIGAQLSLVIAFVSVSISAIVGIGVGSVAGYAGGTLDSVFMRIVDIVFAFPVMLLALLIVAMLGPNTRNVIIGISIVYIGTFARLARGGMTVARNDAYVLALRAMHFRWPRIVFGHILHNIGGPLIVQYALSLGFAIIIEASLGYLGVGVQPPTPTLGQMINSGQQYVFTSPFPALVPCVALILLVATFNMAADETRRLVDPRSGRRGGGAI